MRKPLNSFALAMWILAAFISVIEVLIYGRSPPSFAGHSFEEFIVAFVILFRGIVPVAAVLVALGAMIELLDQIRWNALPPDSRQRPKSAWKSVRRWPHAASD